MDGDLVTIVIPAYNAELFLHENIDTILNQTYKNLEIIYICDGCTDHTEEILREYSKKDSRMIVWVETENHGAAISRNIGMNMANGEWLAFWDADDLYEYNAIEEMYEAAVKEQADLVCCYWNYFDDTPDKDNKIDDWLKRLYCSTYPVINTREELYHILQLVTTVPCNKLIHRSLCEREDAFFQDIPNANDVYFSKVVAMSSHKIVYVDKVFYHYRSNRGRHTISTDRDKKKNYLYEAYDKIFEYIKDTKEEQLLRRSFYNDIINNLNVYQGSPGYNALLDVLQDVYLEKWGMNTPEIKEGLSCVNRIFYENILSNNRNINLQDIYMQAKVECVRVLSHKGCSIWGVGEMGSALLERIAQTDIKIQHVFDSAQDKWGREIHGYVVENFNETQMDHVIVTTSKYYNEIVKLIGNRTDNIYNLDEQIWLIPKV